MRFLIATSFVLLLGCELCRSTHVQNKAPRVHTPLGGIEGIWQTSSKGRQIEAYLGIPYALPPLAEQRFEIAKPVTPWMGLWKATKYAPPCMQIGVDYLFTNIPVVTGAEDCLYVNVFTPAGSSRRRIENPNHLLPVIFFIHGGAFQFGNPEKYGPKYLLNEDVILVTFSYRVGLLGFMSTEDDTVSGNMGLKDQVLALRWVSENICYFGGDPKRVTLVGLDAGAVSVQYHYLTDVTKGLFQRGLSIGGSVMNSWAQTEEPLKKAKLVASAVGCPTKDSSSMVDCLKVQPANRITLASAKLRYWLMNPAVISGPVVEKGNCNYKFIDQPPIKSLITGRVQDLPWIASAASSEGLILALQFITNRTRLHELNHRWLDIAPSLLDYESTIPNYYKKAVSQRIREYYLGTSPIDFSTVRQMITMISDRMFGYDYEKAVMLHAAAIHSPVRYYTFSWRGRNSGTMLYTKNNINYGVVHGDEVSYAMNSYVDTSSTKEDRKMQDVMVKLWVSFARTGVPEVGIGWPKVNPRLKTLQYLRIARPDNIFTTENKNYGNKNFWQTIPFQENLISS